MPVEIPAGELAYRSIGVDHPARTEPLFSEHEGMLAVDDRSPHDEPLESRAKQDVHERLPTGGDTGLAQSLTQMRPRHRSVLAQRSFDRCDSASQTNPTDAVLTQLTVTHAPQTRSRDGVEQRLILSCNQMQRAAINPRDDEGPLLGQRPIDVRAMPAASPSPNRQPRCTWVLRLHRKQRARHIHWIRSQPTRQTLGSQSRGKDSRLVV
jgi:hypothetical protein